MPCLPRQPRNSEVAIELRFIVAANYKLGARRGHSNAAWRLPEFSDLTLEKFFDGAKECSGDIDGAVSDAERESSMNAKSGLPPPRLFFVPIPDPLLSRLLICGASSKEQPQRQELHPLDYEEQRALEKALARVPHLVEGLECCTLKLRPKEGDIMGICCSRVEQISDILFWLLPYRVHIIVFADDPVRKHCPWRLLASAVENTLIGLSALCTASDDKLLQNSTSCNSAIQRVVPSNVSYSVTQREHCQMTHQTFAVRPAVWKDAGALDKLVSTPPFRSMKGRVFLLPLTGDLESAALKVSGGVGLSKLLVTPSAAEALQHRLQHSSGSNAREPAPRSIMTLLLLSLGPGGSLISGGLLGGLDEEEEAALLAKSAAVSYYNPEMLAVTQGGSQIRQAGRWCFFCYADFWVEALAALSEYAENPPGAHEAICFSIQERERAMERLQHNPFAPLCLRVVPSATAH